MAKRATIHIPDHIIAIIGDPPEPSMSGRIADLVAAYAHVCQAAQLGTGMDDAGQVVTAMVRYRAILRESMPVLTEAEWSLLCDVLNGSWLVAEHGDLDPARILWAEVADAGAEYGAKWGVDTDRFAARLRDATYAERCAIMDVVARFWRSPRLNQASVREVLMEAGAKLAD